MTRIFSEEADQEAPSEMSTSVNEDEEGHFYVPAGAIDDQGQ